MKAIVCTKYGPPDILQLQEVEKPMPLDNQVLIQVHAASVNPADWHAVRGEPFLARLMIGGLLRPKHTIPGADISGRVEEVGRNVTQFHPGDEVFGRSHSGGFAEYVCIGENTLALKPANMTFEQAAAVPVAAITALQGLRDKGHVQSGQKVLVNGASGGVGTFAVQIAKSYGAKVTGVCSTRNLDMVHSIGADHVIDYTQEDFTRNGRHYDLIYDAVGNRSVSDYKRALNPGGTCVIAGFSSFSRLIEHAILGSSRTKTGNKTVGLMGVAKINAKDLAVLKELFESGKVVPVIDRRYPLSDVPEAFRYAERGHARGKVIIAVDGNGKRQTVPHAFDGEKDTTTGPY